MLGCFAGEADVGNDERKLVAVAAHRQHHAEISEGGVNNQARGPLRRFRLIVQNIRGHQQVREEQAEQQAKRRRGKCAQ